MITYLHLYVYSPEGLVRRETAEGVSFPYFALYLEIEAIAFA